MKRSMNPIFLLFISVVIFTSASVVGQVEAAENDKVT